MKIVSLSVQNYRGFGRKTTINFSPTHNCIVGPNNVGKSSIFEAIRVAVNPYTSTPIEFYHRGRNSEIAEIELELDLEPDEFRDFVRRLHPLAEPERPFSDRIKILTRYTLGERYFEISCGLVKIANEINPTLTPDFEWKRGDSFANISQADIDDWNILLDDRISSQPETPLFTPPQLKSLFEYFQSNLIFIDEYRSRPNQSLANVSNTPTGENLAAMLSTLKNGNRQARDIFARIRLEFARIYPDHDLETIHQEGNRALVGVTDSNHESTTDYVGSGVIQTANILAHLLSRQKKPVLIDEPELHLHPQSQRNVSKLIQEHTSAQTVIVTHSPYFIPIVKKPAILRVIKGADGVKIYVASTGGWEGKELEKIRQELDAGVRELFFAKKGLIIEGETEQGALPVLAQKLYPLDENGVAALHAGGNGGLAFLAELCESVDLPFVMIADGDNGKPETERVLAPLRKKYGSDLVIAPADFEGLFTNECVDAGRGYRSKPQRGRAMALKAIERGEIPKEIESLFSKLKGK